VGGGEGRGEEKRQSEGTPQAKKKSKRRTYLLCFEILRFSGLEFLLMQRNGQKCDKKIEAKE
jgi:hypothetical protein